jgi:phosphopantetheinyl transferase
MQRQRQQARLLLAAELVEASSFRNEASISSSHRLHEGFEITSDGFGAPHLVVQGIEGPGISFSYLRNAIWAALCGKDCRCGIDAAHSDDFSDDYPYHRAFSREEIEDFLSVTNGNTAEAAALIWSAKEAVVKALGCAFHLIDPLQVQVGSCGSSLGGAILLTAKLSAHAREKLSEGSLQRISLATVLVRSTWVSLAVTNGNRPGEKSRR